MGADGALIGRQIETARLRQLLAAAAGGQGGALAVVADAGMGKSALLDHVLADRPAGMLPGRRHRSRTLTSSSSCNFAGRQPTRGSRSSRGR